MSKIPEIKDIDSIRANLKKKKCLLESATGRKNKLKNEVMSLEAEKNSLMVNLQEQQESVRHKSEIQKELRTKLSNTEEQKVNTELGCENVFHTVEKYKKKIIELQITHSNNSSDNVSQENVDGIEEQIESLMSQVYGNSTVIDKLWNRNIED